MKTVMIALWALGGFAAVAGCSRDDGGHGDGKVATAAGESIGVAECDDYLKKFDECSAKNPALKASMGDSVKQYREGWKAAAATPQGKESLKTKCKSSIELLAASCR
ncbi:MAG: hypothetical protein ABJE95_13515 [Byssovorax sp.]